MNSNNYGTREACKRLVDAGIVLETDQQWYILKNGDCYLSGESVPMIEIVKEYPAPSMAEVWRELPEFIEHKDRIYNKCLVGYDGLNIASYDDNRILNYDDLCENTNPTDALIDLLIWVSAQKERV